MYCFLNCVYTDENDKSILYEVVRCDETFSIIQVERVTLSELELLAATSGLKTDFSFEDGYLKCNTVKRFWCDESIKSSASKHQVIEEKFNTEKTIYTLLSMGVKENFYFIADELVDLAKYQGTGIVPFSHVKFSQSSMSVYYREVLNGVGRNHYLISTEANSIRFNPFYFLVPSKRVESIPFERKGAIVVNNVEYSVYYSGNLGIVEPVKIGSAALVNQASSERVKSASAVKATDFVLGPVWGESGKIQWDGSNRTSHHIRTITFNPSQKVLSNSSIEGIYQNIMDNGRSGIKAEYSYPAFVVANWFVWMMENQTNETELIAAAKQFKEGFSKQLFFADLYLYRIRVFACYGIVCLPMNQPLCGGVNGGFTVIKEVDQ